MKLGEMTMIPLIEPLALFIIAFICFFIIYKILYKNEQVEDYNKILEKKILTLSQQQDMLLESANERVSTFIKLEHEEFSQGGEGSDTINDKIKRIMKKAGISDMSVLTFSLLCCLGGSGFAAFIIHFDFLNFITGLPIGFCIGAYLIYNFLASQAAKKRMAFLKQFPDAIDMIIRGVKAGLNINRIIRLVSIESKDPIASEYRTISQKFDLGMEPEKVLVEAAERIDIEEFRFLVVALVLQMENGGVLGEILMNLSSLVRKRLELGLKLKDMSAEARMSAIVISALPFVFAGIMMIVNPNHLSEFTKPGSGQTLLKIAIALFSIGSFLMVKATKIKV